MRGFSLIELLIVLSLIGITAFFVSPPLRQIVQQTTDNLAQNQLLQHIQQAQQITMIKAIPVALCLSDDGMVCSENKGMHLLTFINRYHDGVVHEKSQLLFNNEIKGDGALHFRAFPYYRHYMQFLPVTDEGNDNGTFWYCSKSKIVKWAVAVSRLGEPHIIKNTSDWQLQC